MKSSVRTTADHYYYYYNYYNYYIDRRIYLNFSKLTQNAAGLKALKPAVNGRYLMCKSLPYYFRLLYRSTFILLSPSDLEGCASQECSICCRGKVYVSKISVPPFKFKHYTHSHTNKQTHTHTQTFTHRNTTLYTKTPKH